MTMTDLLACPPALHNRIRAEHSVVRDITHAALAKGATIALRDEEDSFRKVDDWYDLKARMHDTESQTLRFTFPAGTFAVEETRMYLYLVYGNDGPDVVSDYGGGITSDRAGASLAVLEAWFEPIWERAVAEAGRKFGIEV
jgi:hypothetical protein